jgi:stearoyl-CoA desaturase (delta-9 desaturase)
MNALIATLVMTHLTIICVTVYLHRGQAHKGLTFNPVLEHLMRFYLWLTTGMITKEWVSTHRKHHRYTEQEGDPHSPHIFGIWTVFFKGAFLYHIATKDRAMVKAYGAGTPDDWIERNLYSAHSRLGIVIMLIIDLYFFQLWGWLVWGVQMIWIPLTAAGIINGFGHWFGYRNTETKDFSTNLTPMGIWIGGEELHSNHHAEPANPKLSRMWWEFDIGWMYIQLFRRLGLVKLRRDI